MEILASQGGTLILSSYIGLDPASTVYQKKYQEYRALQQNICNPKNIPIHLKKRTKLHRKDPKN